MNPSTTFLTLAHTARKTGQALLVISVLTLLLLIAAGAGFFHPASWQASLIAATNGTIHVGGAQLAATNGDIHISADMQARSSQAGVQLAASVGDVHIGNGGANRSFSIQRRPCPEKQAAW